MRLSEAIRLGAMATAQGFGPSSIGSDDRPCALGAARLAAGISCDLICRNWLPLIEAWPILLAWAKYPKGDGTLGVVEIIWKLNDEHRWTREQIADWVQTIEPAQVPSERPRASHADGLQAPHAELVGVEK